MDFFQKEEGVELTDIGAMMTGVRIGHLLSKVKGVMFCWEWIVPMPSIILR